MGLSTPIPGGLHSSPEAMNSPHCFRAETGRTLLDPELPKWPM